MCKPIFEWQNYEVHRLIKNSNDYERQGILSSFRFVFTQSPTLSFGLVAINKYNLVDMQALNFPCHTPIWFVLKQKSPAGANEFVIDKYSRICGTKMKNTSVTNIQLFLKLCMLIKYTHSIVADY